MIKHTLKLSRLSSPPSLRPFLLGQPLANNNRLVACFTNRCRTTLTTTGLYNMASSSPLDGATASSPVDGSAKTTTTTSLDQDISAQQEAFNQLRLSGAPADQIKQA